MSNRILASCCWRPSISRPRAMRYAMEIRWRSIEHGAVFAAGNDLWRKRGTDLRASQPPGPHPGWCRQLLSCMGQIAGEESHTLLSTEVPTHTHPLRPAPGQAPPSRTDRSWPAEAQASTPAQPT